MNNEISWYGIDTHHLHEASMDTEYVPFCKVEKVGDKEIVSNDMDVYILQGSKDIMDPEDNEWIPINIKQIVDLTDIYQGGANTRRAVKAIIAAFNYGKVSEILEAKKRIENESLDIYKRKNEHMTRRLNNSKQGKGK